MPEKLTPPRGFLFAGSNVSIKRPGKNDLGVIISESEASAAAVFTSNLFQAAPVLISRRRIRRGKAWAILVNSGNANCGTGKAGLEAARKTGAALARHLCINQSSILLASTGVIGEPLPYKKIIRGIPKLLERASPRGYEDFETAIMTTDTRKKISSRVFTIRGKEVRLLGLAKGAGMIQPQMATMLGFVLTDAELKPGHLAKLLKQSADVSFNRITIDGDTSTNDTVFALANGASRVAFAPDKPGWNRFSNALKEVCLELAQMIVADGEGASRWFYVQVSGAGSDSEAEKIARRIANSPLVKTAISAADPNWGRIIAAAGISGARFDVRKTRLELIAADGGRRIEILKGGARSSSYQGRNKEDEAARVLSRSGFRIVFDAGRGKGDFEILTCDFTQEYVKINAEYRS